MLHATVWAIAQPRQRPRSSVSLRDNLSNRSMTCEREWPSSKLRMIGAIANSRSPVSGFGSMTSHGSRSAARTFSAWRSWCTRTCSPWLFGRSRRWFMAASTSSDPNGRPAASQSHIRLDLHSAASSAKVLKGDPAGFHKRSYCQKLVTRVSGGAFD